MKNVYGCHICSLRVRVSNRAAISLYTEVLGYKIHDVEKGYYADKEDAYDMRFQILELPMHHHYHGLHHHGGQYTPQDLGLEHETKLLPELSKE